MSLILTLCKKKEKWDDFVEKSPQGNIFCTTQFLEALGVDYDLVLIEDNNQLKMGAIIIKEEGIPIKSPYPFTMYQGILFDNSIYNMPNHRRAKIVQEITQYLLGYLKDSYYRISFCLHYFVDDLRSFQWFNYHNPDKGQFVIKLQYTAILNLLIWQSFEQYLSSIRAVRRQEFNKSKSSNLKLELSKDISMLDRLHEKTFKRQGIERKAEAVRLLRSITRSALSNGYGQLLLCKNADHVVISATVFLYDSRCGYYMFAATDPEYRKTGCGTYLMLENIRQCKEKGLSKIDMVGINSPRRGDFKTSFNAVPLPYFIVHWEKPS
jgi:GNAT superfamily N-acetyltransferase